MEEDEIIFKEGEHSPCVSFKRDWQIKNGRKEHSTLIEWCLMLYRPKDLNKAFRTPHYPMVTLEEVELTLVSLLLGKSTSGGWTNSLKGFLCTCVFSRWLETRVWYWVGPISEKPPTDKEGVVRNRNCQLNRHVHWTKAIYKNQIHNLLSKL